MYCSPCSTIRLQHFSILAAQGGLLPQQVTVRKQGRQHFSIMEVRRWFRAVTSSRSVTFEGRVYHRFAVVFRLILKPCHGRVQYRGLVEGVWQVLLKLGGVLSRVFIARWCCFGEECRLGSMNLLCAQRWMQLLQSAMLVWVCLQVVFKDCTALKQVTTCRRSRTPCLHGIRGSGGVLQAEGTNLRGTCRVAAFHQTTCLSVLLR